MKKYSTKKALVASILALCMCLTAFVGTTFAWFTDSVTSANNIIKSGNLDVDVYYGDPADKNSIENVSALFNDVALWEPGAVAYENLTVQNLGTLALKYRMVLNFTNATKVPGTEMTLADVLKVAVIAGGFYGDRVAAQNLAYNYSLSTFALEGKLESGANDVYGIVIYWQPTSYDNNYNVDGGLSIELGINLVATQWNNDAELDSFGPDYDVLAPMPEIPGLTEIEKGSATANVSNDGSASMDVDAAPSANTDKTVIDAPAGTFESTDKVEVTVDTVNNLFDVTAAGGVVAALDINMTVNGAPTSADLTDGKVFTVTTYISKGLTNVSVVYTGTDGKDQPTLVSYDAVTGKLVFTTNHFSNYAVNAAALAYDAESDVAYATVEQVVEVTKVENSTVTIPEVNQEVILDLIEKSEILTEEEKAVAIVATAAAQIGETTYATLAEAFAAVKNGETIVLLNNVTLVAGTTFTVASGNAIVLDLNGKTIVGIDNTTANFGLINVGAGATLTVKGEGKITLSATTNNGWNRYSSVISNQRGTLIVNGGTIEHLGGTDMSYAIDNLTNTGAEPAKTVINGGTVQSTYIGIRQFCNAATGLNELEINGGTVIGAKRSVWMQQPNSIVNLAKLTINGGTLYGNLTIGADNFEVAIAGGYFTDLQSALKYAVDGATIGLAGDATVDMNETFTIANGFDLVIDLNGYKVTSTADKSGNQELFLVKGNLTVKNGSLEYTALNNQGWNAMITIFDVTAGGVLNLDGVDATVAGSDMNFIVHLNNWGTASFYVNNSTLKATYVAVRVFNSGYDVNNVTITNSTLSTTGNSAFWVHNYTAADFGTQEKADAQAKLLNFSFENVKFEAVKAAFRYGFTNAEYYTADGKQLVTATTLAEVMAYAKKGNVIIDAQGANLGDFNYDGTFANGTVLKNAKFTYVYGLSVDGLVVFENCEFVSDHSYSANFSDGSTKGEVIFNNCYFDGWNSFGDLITNVEMNNCTFDWNNPYSVLRFYQNAQLNNCTFIAIDGIDTNKTGTVVELNNCTGIEGKIYNNGDQVGTWIVNGADVSDTITSW